MNHSNPRRFVGTWDRMTSADTPGEDKLLPMLFVDRFEKYDVNKQNYIDLIEMASDLT
jgi:hypothetical protein